MGSVDPQVDQRDTVLADGREGDVWVSGRVPTGTDNRQVAGALLRKEAAEQHRLNPPILKAATTFFAQEADPRRR